MIEWAGLAGYDPDRWWSYRTLKWRVTSSMGKLLLSWSAALLVTGLAVGAAHADVPNNFHPRGPFATVQECQAAKAAAAKRGERQGTGACSVDSYSGRKGFYYMVKNG